MVRIAKSLSIEQEMLNEATEYADNHGISFNALVYRALRDYMKPVKGPEGMEDEARLMSEVYKKQERLEKVRDWYRREKASADEVKEAEENFIAAKNALDTLRSEKHQRLLDLADNEHNEGGD